MMAAIRASQLQPEVILIEKNPHPGKKLLYSGKGRCNLTNAGDLYSFIKRFSHHNGQFLRDAFGKFFNTDLILFFEKRGVKLKFERQSRVFPASDKSHSILAVLKKELQKNKVQICYNSSLKDIFIQEKAVKGLLLQDGKTIITDRIILATGGVSYGFTGSTGEGIEIARRLGHRVVSLRPGLVPLVVRQDYPRLLEGLTLKNIRLTFSDTEKQIVSPVGELIFTHFGISGPLVLSLSGTIVDWLNENKTVIVQIDLKPALTAELLEQRLIREFKANPTKTIKNTVKNLLPKSLADVFISITAIPEDKKANQVTQEERKKLVALLKSFSMNIISARPIEEAMITRGGVSLKDINPRSMESRLIKGLYFAGEMIDIDADTGGFNLQAAFSTGYLAGESAALS